MAFHRDKNQYVLGAVIGTTSNATIYVAKHVSPETGTEVPVAIKIVNINKIENIYSFVKEIHEAETYNHENIVKVHCSFKVKDQLWLVMSPLSGFWLQSMIQSSFPNGLPESAVAFILKEALKAIDYLHEKNKFHQDIGPGCIFLDEKLSTIKLSLFALTFEDPNPNSSSNGFPNSILAPELMNDYAKGGDKATDIWMSGLLALELFYGRLLDFGEFQFLLKRINDEFGTSKKNGSHKASGFLGKLKVFSCFSNQTKNIPRPMGEFIAACLAGDPKKRPTANQLMEFDFFKNCTVGKESLAKLKK